MKIKLQAIFSYLESGLIERTVPVRLSLLAALSGEHLLLLGPPGTAKSEMARKLSHVFSNINYFERLLTRFSVPEELFGPLSIKALEDDRYHRLTESYLPDASVAFIDEIFNANSAILNALLTILNEREFDNGRVRVKTPLISVIAASNNLPDDESLDALYDRFLFRYQVMPVSDEGFDALLSLKPGSVADAVLQKLTTVEIEMIQQQSESIELSPPALELIRNLRRYLTEQSIYISDRRWRKALKILRVSAFTSNKATVDEWDCVLLVHLMWQQPDEITELTNWFVKELKLDIQGSVKRIGKLVEVWELKLEEDAMKHIQKTNVHGDYLYKTPEGKMTTQHERVSLAERDNEVLFLAPQGNKDRSNKGNGYTLIELEKTFFDDSYKQTHIDGLWVDVQNYINNTQNRLVNRVAFEAMVEPYYFSAEYLTNQRADLNEMIAEVSGVCDEFLALQAELVTVNEHHLWLAGGLVELACDDIKALSPKLVDYQQRLIALLQVNESLNSQEHIQPSHS